MPVFPLLPVWFPGSLLMAELWYGSGAKVWNFKVNLETWFHKEHVSCFQGTETLKQLPVNSTVLCGLALVSSAMCFFLKAVFKCKINLWEVSNITACTFAEVYVSCCSSWNVNTLSIDMILKKIMCMKNEKCLGKITRQKEAMM